MKFLPVWIGWIRIRIRNINPQSWIEYGSKLDPAPQLWTVRLITNFLEVLVGEDLADGDLLGSLFLLLQAQLLTLPTYHQTLSSEWGS